MSDGPSDSGRDNEWKCYRCHDLSIVVYTNADGVAETWPCPRCRTVEFNERYDQEEDKECDNPKTR